MLDTSDRLKIVDLIAQNARRLSAAEREKIIASLAWYSMREFCELTGYSVRAVRMMVDSGMPAYRGGSGKGFAFRFDQRSIEWLQDNARRAA